MNQLSCILDPLSLLCQSQGLPSPRLEFSRRGTGHVTCPVALAKGREAQDAASALAQAWNEAHLDLARAEAVSGFLNLTLTEAVLLQAMESLSLEERSLAWGDPHAAQILRLRADRAFHPDAPFDVTAAMAVLRAQASLPYDAQALTCPLHPAISRAWEAVLERKIP